MPLLIRAFRDSNRGVQENAARVFAKIGEASLPLLQKTLRIHGDAPRQLTQHQSDTLLYGLAQQPKAQSLWWKNRSKDPGVRFMLDATGIT